MKKKAFVFQHSNNTKVAIKADSQEEAIEKAYKDKIPVEECVIIPPKE